MTKFMLKLKYTEADIELGELMHHIWTAFDRTHDETFFDLYDKIREMRLEKVQPIKSRDSKADIQQKVNNILEVLGKAKTMWQETLDAYYA